MPEQPEPQPSGRNIQRAEHILNHYSNSRNDILCLARRLDRDDEKLTNP